MTLLCLRESISKACSDCSATSIHSIVFSCNNTQYNNTVTQTCITKKITLTMENMAKGVLSTCIYIFPLCILYDEKRPLFNCSYVTTFVICNLYWPITPTVLRYSCHRMSQPTPYHITQNVAIMQKYPNSTYPLVSSIYLSLSLFNMHIFSIATTSLAGSQTISNELWDC